MSTFKLISRSDIKLIPSSWRHCVHVMIHASMPDTLLFNNVPVRHAVMMQMRFDGRLGFPGGFVDYDDKSLEDALYRELSEEMGLLPKKFEILTSDYLFTHRFEEKKYCLHFYGKEVTPNEYLQIEKRDGVQNYDGFEVLGVLRVPLYIMGDKRGGFPAFLRNNFIGISKEQLISGIRARKLIPEELISMVLNLSTLTDNLSNSPSTVTSSSANVS